MIITDDFGKLVSLQDTEVIHDPDLGDFEDAKFGPPLLMGESVPHWSSFGDVIGEMCTERGLVLQKVSPRGMYQVDEGGNQRRRCKMYALVPSEETTAGVRGIVEAIANAFGPGRWWALRADGHPPISYLTRRDASPGMIPNRLVGGVPHVLLGCYYVHENMPVVP